MRSGWSSGRITVSPSGTYFASTPVIARKSRGCLRSRECPRAGRGGRRIGFRSGKASPPRRPSLAVARPSGLPPGCRDTSLALPSLAASRRIPRVPELLGSTCETRPRWSRIVREVQAMKAGSRPRDPIGPRDWHKLLPFAPTPASDRLGWTGLEAASAPAAPSAELDRPALTHHTLVLFSQPPGQLELRY